MRRKSNEKGIVSLARLRNVSLHAPNGVLLAGMLASVGLLSGCSGLVNGKTTTTPPPPQTYSISGTISPVTGGSGATVTLSGAASASATTDGSGNYTFSGLANGTYTVTPSHTGYTFTPSSQSATINGANVTGVNFTAAVQSGQTYSISGTISPVTGGSGATVTLSGKASATTTTNGSGSYTFSGLTNGTYAVTPSHTGYTFTPSSQSATINGANITAVNFTAVAQVPHSALLSWNASTSTVSGYNLYRSTVSGTQYVKLNSSLVTSLSYTDTTVQNGTTYYYVATAVDANGVESVYSNEVSAIIP
jgi:Carboxypeptidase regulatory-like domain/SdrD B-like domain